MLGCAYELSGRGVPFRLLSAPPSDLQRHPLPEGAVLYPSRALVALEVTLGGRGGVSRYRVDAAVAGAIGVVTGVAAMGAAIRPPARAAEPRVGIRR